MNRFSSFVIQSNLSYTIDPSFSDFNPAKKTSSTSRKRPSLRPIVRLRLQRNPRTSICPRQPIVRNRPRSRIRIISPNPPLRRALIHIAQPKRQKRVEERARREDG